MSIGKSTRRAIIAVAWLLSVFAAALFLGCKSAGTRLQSEIDRLPWRADTTAATPPAATPPAAYAPDTPASALPPAPDPEPAAAEVPPAVPAAEAGMQWIPEQDCVRIIIPAAYPHWQISICTTSPRVNHQVGLYGPAQARGTLTARGYEHVLQGGAATWHANAMRIDPAGGGRIVVFLNTNDMQPSGYRTAHWVVADPRVASAGTRGAP
jgi:hypothetical protein